MNQNPKILVVRMSSLGDIVLTTPIYRNLKNQWQNCHITVLVKKKFSQIPEKFKNVDEVLTYKGFFKTLHEIRAKNFTHYLDLHSTLRSVIIGIFSKIKNRARYKKDSLARRLFVKFKVINPSLERHTLDRYLETLKKYNVTVTETEPSLTDWDYNKQSAENLKPKKIAILQTAFLGDAVLTLPLIEKTSEIFKDASLTVICRPESAEIFKSSPHVSKVIVDDKKRTPFVKSFKTLVSNLKKENLDIILIPHRSIRSALASYVAKIPVRVGFNKSAGRMFLNKTVAFSWLLHDAERNLSLLEPFKVNLTKQNPACLTTSVSSSQEIEDILREHNLMSVPLAGIHAGSVWETKRWPKQYYSKLIDKLSDELGIKSVLIGTGQDADIAEQITGMVKGSKPLNLIGKTSISQLMALMKNLKLFVTNDSGPMHIATAFNVPTVAIFGPTTKELGFFPYSKNAVVVEKNLKCRPCSLHGKKKCPHGHFLCMKLITPAQVLHACKNLIKK
ncbi:MAG TPA: lipopolysaccharide heptosyltransferase II [Elusimicrobiales bacterium]|nr:lipopolysaccharide heptosyltransferase II [Elusimicrobiales bacterium]